MLSATELENPDVNTVLESFKRFLSDLLTYSVNHSGLAQNQKEKILQLVRRYERFHAHIPKLVKRGLSLQNILKPFYDEVADLLLQMEMLN